MKQHTNPHTMPSGDSMKTALPPLAANYLHTINEHDRGAFLQLFATDAIVDDNFREIRGIAAIEPWSTKEIFGAQVVMELRGAEASGEQIVLTTKVDGNFDRTGLPDPVIIRHTLAWKGNTIVHLTCRLAET